MASFVKKNSLLVVLFPFSIAILLQFFPLTNTTGYEFSFVMSFPLFLCGGFFVHKRRSINEQVYLISLIIILPLIVSVLSSIFFSPCPLTSDILFYIVISIPAFFFGYVTGFTVHKFFEKFTRTIFVLFFLLILFISLFEFYFLPQIYFFNLVFGYFPGTIYDELIVITDKLLLFRLLNFVFLGILFWMLLREKSKAKLVGGIIFSIIAWFFFLKGTFGFITTENLIERELSNKIETPHFEIYTDENFAYDFQVLQSMHEFYYTRISEKFKLSNEIKIKSYIFKNRQQKKQLFGSENADVAKPWLKQIYLDERSFESTLEHELVHVLASEFGSTPFKVAASINPALIEGLAMAVENEYNLHSIDYAVRLAESYGYSVSLVELFSGLNFFQNTSSLSYLYAGSFIKYLNNQYGIESVKNLYSSGSFEDSFNKEIELVENDYKESLDSLNYKLNENTAQLYFGRKPLLKKICPRYAARLLNHARDEFRIKNYEQAYGIFSEVYEYSKSYSALSGMLHSKIELNDFKSAESILEDNYDNFKNTSYFYNLELIASDISILNSDSAAGVNLLNELSKQQPSYGYRQEAELRLELISDGIKFYKNYMELGWEEKLSIIVESFKRSDNKAVFVSTLIDLSKVTGKTSFYLELINDIVLSNNQFNIYAAFDIARFAMSLGDLKTAQKFLDFALMHNTEKQLDENLSEYAQLIEWTKQNSR